MSKFVFDKSNCFCISLLSQIERWSKMEQRFATIGIEVSKIPASVGGTSDIVDYFDNRLNNGQIGCSQSHVKVWHHILTNKLPYAFILEDDACFVKDWRNKLDKFFKDINDTEWDLILLNASEPCYPLDEWKLCKEQFLTGGYIISLKGVKEILKMFSGRYCSSDWMTSRIQLHNHSYSYFPWLIIQEGKETTIGSNIVADHEKVLHCLNSINYSIDNYTI